MKNLYCAMIVEGHDLTHHSKADALFVLTDKEYKSGTTIFGPPVVAYINVDVEDPQVRVPEVQVLCSDWPQITGEPHLTRLCEQVNGREPKFDNYDCYTEAETSGVAVKIICKVNV